MPSGTEEIDHLLSGAVDTHIHTGPDAFERHDTDLEVARKARDHDMDAVLIKSHHFETGSRARIASQETGFTVLGGITLNEWAGGLNPWAVDGAANLGVDLVWMPTLTARNHIERGFVPHLDAETPRGNEAEGITVLEDGELVEDALVVLDRVAANDLALSLGHLSPTEGLALAEEAIDRGVREVLCIHPHAAFLDYSHDQLATLVDMGAVVELHWAMTTEMMDEVASVEDFVAVKDRVGPENVILATDGGSMLNPPAMEMYKQFLTAMVGAGVPDDEMKQMTEHTPKRVYQLD
jgi:hypothetical protein